MAHPFVLRMNATTDMLKVSKWILYCKLGNLSRWVPGDELSRMVEDTAGEVSKSSNIMHLEQRLRIGVDDAFEPRQRFDFPSRGLTILFSNRQPTVRTPKKQNRLIGSTMGLRGFVEPINRFGSM